MKEMLLVGIGGFVGSASRYGIYLISAKQVNDNSYLATLIVNLAGCFLIGLLAGGFMKLNQNQNFLLVTGLCGGFTTFSTFAFDGLKLLKTGAYLEFGIYSVASVIGGLLLCFAGFYISNR